MKATRDFLKFARSPLAALTVVAALGAANMAHAERGGACMKDCSPTTPVTPTPEEPVTSDTTFNNSNNNENNNSNENVNNNHNNNTATGGNAVAHGGNATAHGGQGGNASSDANSNADANANADADANVTIGDTHTNSSASVGNTTSGSTSSANNGGQSQSFNYSNTESANAYAPAAMATAGNGVTCGKSIGISFGMGQQDIAVSGGLNLPAGVNETCMTHERATTIMGAGVATYHLNQAGGADLIGVGVAVMMQEDKKVDQAVKFIARQNCTSGNALDRFRPGCGGATGTVLHAPALK